jgi:hypothetical protein
MTDSMTAAQIRACLEADDFSLYGVEDADDWGYEIGELADRTDGGVSALVAFTHAFEDGRQSVTLDWSDFKREFERMYQGLWTRPGAFARYLAEEATEFGTPQEQRGRREFLKRYGDLIDWDADAESPEMSDYTMIKADPSPASTAVYVFQPGA